MTFALVGKKFDLFCMRGLKNAFTKREKILNRRRQNRHKITKRRKLLHSVQIMP